MPKSNEAQLSLFSDDAIEHLKTASSRWEGGMLGSTLAKKGVIVVTPNYRVNVFGWLAHPELTAESPNHASGNYGALDQIAAIKWVKNNIAGFGGDPDKITIWGQSGGARSVNWLVATPLANLIAREAGFSRVLFCAAILYAIARIAFPETRSSSKWQNSVQPSVAAE